MIHVQIDALRYKKDPSGPVTIFTLLKNEIYFLPFFLDHYRKLGVRDFLFLDDRSNDGSVDYLLSQPDCSVLVSDVAYGEEINGIRFGVLAKTLIPQEFLENRWVLSVDADEFLAIPSRYAALDDLLEDLDANGLKAARALMVDFFPHRLVDIDETNRTIPPFEACPFFNAIADIDWPDDSFSPRSSWYLNSIRPHMYHLLLSVWNPELQAELARFRRDYKVASLHKVPLVRWTPGTAMRSPHEVNFCPSSRIQLGLAHFKFYPGFRQKIDEAIQSKSHWNKSMEYEMLSLFLKYIPNVDLSSPHTRHYKSPLDLENEKIVYSCI